jgi:hypothetical protein
MQQIGVPTLAGRGWISQATRNFHQQLLRAMDQHCSMLVAARASVNAGEAEGEA